MEVGAPSLDRVSQRVQRGDRASLGYGQACSLRGQTGPLASTLTSEGRPISQISHGV